MLFIIVNFYLTLFRIAVYISVDAHLKVGLCMSINVSYFVNTQFVIGHLVHVCRVLTLIVD